MKRLILSYLVITVLAVLAVFTSCGGRGSSSGVSAQDFTKVAEDIMARDSIPEMTFAVITKDSVLIQNILGHHKITELNEKPNASMKDFFHLGSNTKAITGFIGASLVEEGKIKWDTKFFELFPELKNKSNPEYYDITLENLFTHRARIQPFSEIEYPLNDKSFQKNPEFTGSKQERRAKFAEFVLTLTPVENNESYNYSNAGYSLAAVMLEKVSGKSWEELCIEILKEKLKIDFAFGWPNRNYENQPFGHWSVTDDEKLIPVFPDTEWDQSLIEPGGDLSMNIENYVRFIQLNMRGLSSEDNFLKAETYQYLHTAKDRYAIGWLNQNQISSHAGSDGTFFAYTVIDRKNMIGYIVIANCGTGSENAQKGVLEMFSELKKWTQNFYTE